MGEATVEAIKADVARRVAAGEFIDVQPPPGVPGRTFTTREMVERERDTIETMRAGQQAYRPLATSVTRQAVQQASPHLSEHQRGAVDRVLANRDQVVALEGVAGAGKTTALAAVREGAEWEGYRVEGFAPTSRAAQKLADAGIPTSTLQRHLMQSDASRDGSKHLYVLDESSLASTKQMHDFLSRLGPHDRVVLVGDGRQHHAVEAGRPYQQLRRRVSRRSARGHRPQQDPALKHVVEQLSRGEVRGAIPTSSTRGACTKSPTVKSGSPPWRTPTPGARRGRWSCRPTISHGWRSTRRSTD
jgi:predicted ribonuclease YlaK